MLTNDDMGRSWVTWADLLADLGMAIAMETKKLRQIQRALSSSDSDKQRQERVQVIAFHFSSYIGICSIIYDSG